MLLPSLQRKIRIVVKWFESYVLSIKCLHLVFGVDRGTDDRPANSALSVA